MPTPCQANHDTAQPNPESFPKWKLSNSLQQLFKSNKWMRIPSWRPIQKRLLWEQLKNLLWNTACVPLVWESMTHIPVLFLVTFQTFVLEQLVVSLGTEHTECANSLHQHWTSVLTKIPQHFSTTGKTEPSKIKCHLSGCWRHPKRSHCLDNQNFQNIGTIKNTSA